VFQPASCPSPVVLVATPPTAFDMCAALFTCFDCSSCV
jgi:hypothetical protein